MSLQSPDSLLNVSDLLSGVWGVGISKLVLEKKEKPLKIFGKHLGVSIVSRMFLAPNLSTQLNSMNQQYLFAGLGGAVMEGGSSTNMATQGLTYVASNWLGDYTATVANLEKELFSMKATVSATSGSGSTSTP